MLNNYIELDTLNDFFTSSILIAASKTIPYKGQSGAKRLPANVLELIKKRSILRKSYANEPTQAKKSEVNKITSDIKKENK
jgi:hypothetical protein